MKPTTTTVATATEQKAFLRGTTTFNGGGILVQFSSRSVGNSRAKFSCCAEGQKNALDERTKGEKNMPSRSIVPTSPERFSGESAPSFTARYRLVCGEPAVSGEYNQYEQANIDVAHDSPHSLSFGRICTTPRSRAPCPRCRSSLCTKVHFFRAFMCVHSIYRTTRRSSPS